MEQSNALRLALNMLEDTENPRLDEVAIGRAVSFRVVLSWMARLCNAYLGSEVLLECTSRSAWSLSLDAARMSHPPDARSHQQGRRAGGELEAMSHPTSPSWLQHPARADLSLPSVEGLTPPWSTSVSRGANLSILSLPCVRSGSWLQSLQSTSFFFSWASGC
ncbi:hypothetical protein CFAM422_001164 [Trichoderma lentiforme]|uniref:Uncharacterized protein n=1 Tax=Trichoderma lentiforme TaxID=1567552 RepID=A0A9P4XQ70_9HYPO|nr:hypothetical protein CFAM422_001164 [Trichoderma lentiforme]